MAVAHAAPRSLRASLPRPPAPSRPSLLSGDGNAPSSVAEPHGSDKPGKAADRRRPGRSASAGFPIAPIGALPVTPGSKDTWPPWRSCARVLPQAAASCCLGPEASDSAPPRPKHARPGVYRVGGLTAASLDAPASVCTYVHASPPAVCPALSGASAHRRGPAARVRARLPAFDLPVSPHAEAAGVCTRTPPTARSEGARFAAACGVTARRPGPLAARRTSPCSWPVSRLAYLRWGCELPADLWCPAAPPALSCSAVAPVLSVAAELAACR